MLFRSAIQPLADPTNLYGEYLEQGLGPHEAYLRSQLRLVQLQKDISAGEAAGAGSPEGRAQLRRTAAPRGREAVRHPDRAASADAVRAAYRKLALLLHPDKNQARQAEDTARAKGPEALAAYHKRNQEAATASSSVPWPSSTSKVLGAQTPIRLTEGPGASASSSAPGARLAPSCRASSQVGVSAGFGGLQPVQPQK